MQQKLCILAVKNIHCAFLIVLFLHLRLQAKLKAQCGHADIDNMNTLYRSLNVMLKLLFLYYEVVKKFMELMMAFVMN